MRQLILLAAVALATAAASAQTLASADPEASHCRTLKDERDRLAREAMRMEIALVEQYRDRICPALNRQAQRANAEDRAFTPLDFTALLRCRDQAERQLEQERPVLARNSLGFTFYTAAGAAAAHQADQRRAQLSRLGCLP